MRYWNRRYSDLMSVHSSSLYSDVRSNRAENVQSPNFLLSFNQKERLILRKSYQILKLFSWFDWNERDFCAVGDDLKSSGSFYSHRKFKSGVYRCYDRMGRSAKLIQWKKCFMGALQGEWLFGELQITKNSENPLWKCYRRYMEGLEIHYKWSITFL